MRTPLLCSLLLACSKSPPPVDTSPVTNPATGTSTTVGLPTTTTPTAVPPECSLTANALRIACDVALGAEAEATLSIEVAGEALREIPSDPALQHDWVVWDLPPQTDVTWEVTSNGTSLGGGVVQTGTVPIEAAIELVEVQAGPTSIERLFVSVACGGQPSLVAMDGDGVVRWYEPSPGGRAAHGIEFSDRGTFLVSAGRMMIQELHPDGTVLLDLEQGVTTGFTEPVHHDLASQNGQTVSLNARPVLYGDGNEYLNDGLYAVSGSTVTDVWNLGDVLDPTGFPEPPGAYWQGNFPGAIDYGHANSIDIDARGMWLISFKHLDTIMAVHGDPADPLYGQIAWTLVGGTRGQTPSLALSSSTGLDPGFVNNHHADWVDSDTITLVDNGESPLDPTRVLTIEIDEVAGTADVIEAYPLGTFCPIQSSGFRLPDGSMTALCTLDSNVYEFDPAGPLRRQNRIRCGDGSPATAVIRAIPFATEDYR